MSSHLWSPLTLTPLGSLHWTVCLYILFIVLFPSIKIFVHHSYCVQGSGLHHLLPKSSLRECVLCHSVNFHFFVTAFKATLGSSSLLSTSNWTHLDPLSPFPSQSVLQPKFLSASAENLLNFKYDMIFDSFLLFSMSFSCCEPGTCFLTM